MSSDRAAREPERTAVPTRTLPVMLGVFAVALLVRLLYLFAFRDSPYFHVPVVDAEWHDNWAWAWAEGTWSMDGRAFFRAPLYPLWLSFWYGLLGHDPGAIRVVQGVLGAGTAAAVAGVGVRWAGEWVGAWAGARVGWVAGLLAAAYGPFVFFDGELLIPNLLLSLLAWGLFLLSGRVGWGALVGGAVLWGLAVIARPNALALLPVGVWLVWVGSAGSWRGLSRGLSRGVRVAVFSALLLVPALVVTGVNRAVEGEWVFVASQGGVNFYAGNHVGASGRSVQIRDLGEMVSWREFVDASQGVVARELGREVSSREVSNYWLHRGFDSWREAPGAMLRLTARKAYYLINAYEIPNNRDLYGERPWILRVLLWKTPLLAVPWGLLFPLGVMGLVLGLRDHGLRRITLGLGGWMVLYGASVIPFFVSARFRLPLVIPVVLLAALALTRWRSWRSPVVLVVGLVALLVSNSPLWGVRVDNPTQEMARLASTLLRSGDAQRGVAILEGVREKDPENLTWNYMLAEAYGGAGRFEEALVLYRKVAERRPDDADLLFNLGVAFLELQQPAEAVEPLTRAGEARPDDPAIWVNLGVAREGAGDVRGAESAYLRALELEPDDVLATVRLGGLWVGANQSARAVPLLERVLGAHRTVYELRYLLAVAYARTGELDKALEEIDTALHIQPHDPQGLALQEWIQSQR